MTIHYKNRWGNKKGFTLGKQTLYFVISFDKYQQWLINVERVKLNSLGAIIMVRISYVLEEGFSSEILPLLRFSQKLLECESNSMLTVLRLASGLMSKQCMITLSRILLECLWWIWVEVLFSNGIVKGASYLDSENLKLKS